MVFKKLGLIAAQIMMASQAQALCIVNCSTDAVAYTRGGPFLGMETWYAGTVRPREQHCASISARSDGTYPVSVYTVTRRGKCVIVRGCFYESNAEQFFSMAQRRRAALSPFKTTPIVEDPLADTHAI
jgi:hypothetical protein